MINKIFIVGAGFMGSGIAQVSAAAGYKVTMWDMKEEYVEAAIAKMDEALSKRIAKGKMTEAAKAELLANIETTTNLEDAKDAGLVIEAILENEKLKCEMFAKLDKICEPQTILASNTSALMISNLANATNREGQFLGLHFFSPVPVMKVVEIVKGLKTSNETLAAAKEYIRSLGKEGVLVKDSPGFLVNRIMHAFRQEVFACMEEGVASMEDIDTAVKLALGHPMGPFELNDFAGLDIGLATINTLHDNLKDPKWRPNLTLKKLVNAGDLGRKSGKGWYDYTSGEKKSRTDLNL